MERKMNIKEIKRKRLTLQEKRILKMLENMEEYETIFFPNSVFYKYDNQVVFEKELLNKKFYINYSVFFKMCLNGNEIKIECLLHNIEILLNEEFNLSNYEFFFTTQTYRSFWSII